MRIKLISDCHSNYPALKEAVESEDDEDLLLYLGDIVGLMGFPRETVELIQKEFDYVLKGNHDVCVLEKGQGHVNSRELSRFEHDYIHRNLTDEQKDWIKERKTVLKLDNLECILYHARHDNGSGLKLERNINLGSKPRWGCVRGVDKKEYVEVASEFLKEDENEKYKYMFMGHTHQQHHVDCSKFGHDLLMANPGSVGQSNNDKGSYSIVDTKNREVEHKKVNLNMDRVKKRLNKENVPIKFWR